MTTHDEVQAMFADMATGINSGDLDYGFQVLGGAV